MGSRALATLFGAALISLLLLDTASVWARAGSGGSRGSRSYSPARPAPSPVTPATASSPSPQEIEEFWTFTRPVGPKPWRLSAIQTS